LYSTIYILGFPKQNKRSCQYVNHKKFGDFKLFLKSPTKRKLRVFNEVCLYLMGKLTCAHVDNLVVIKKNIDFCVDS